MHGSASQAALGWIVAALAVAALAAQRSDPSPPARPPVAARPAEAAPELRALRDGERLDLNRASAAELTLLPGIGPKLAERIVAERTRRGGYAQVDDLQDVHGIGPKLWQRVRAFVEVRAASQKRSIR